MEMGRAISEINAVYDEIWRTVEIIETARQEGQDAVALAMCDCLVNLKGKRDCVLQEVHK